MPSRRISRALGEILQKQSTRPFVVEGLGEGGRMGWDTAGLSPSGVRSGVSPCPGYFLTSAAKPEWSEQMWFLLLHPPLVTLRLGACGQTKQPTGRQCGEQQESWRHCDSQGTLRHTYSSRQKTLLAAVYTCSLPQQGCGASRGRSIPLGRAMHSILDFMASHTKTEYLVYSAWISVEEGAPEGTNG